ncbi:hypothetical protein O1611_g662 [Lasiodiplodia mahajangana]|uniref:Uncharacterized protein n=1 Tax=Lasiodiplodia mahajangana TaxID=1108764 RepID=A0ACC2JZK4_9PEZI|nr:hypothetical protein O1611_g662 [Lasiodiplodia mahajangana]
MGDSLFFKLCSSKFLKPPASRVVQDTNDSEESKALILKWRDTCIETHAECRPSDVPTEYWKPTRLLQVESSKENEAEVCKLVNGSQIAEEEGYVALSYCWGKDPRFLKLESGNEHELREGVLLSSLEKTFQDALKVTRWLGYKYIWIDCLCIKQDKDKEDWQTEAPTMKSVYSGASITIVAAHGGDPSSGLFTTRYAESIVPPVIQCSWARSLGPTRTIIYDNLWYYEIDKGPLASRAWAVQERALSRRLVVFGKAQVFFKCSNMNLCESYPNCTPPWSVTGSGTSALFQLSDQVASPENAWSEVARIYSATKLTRDEDKLMALSGLAEKMQRRFPGEDYVVGLWGVNQTHRATELLWTTDHYINKPARRPSPCVAPTWSWLSIITEVSLRDPKKDIGGKVLIKILEVCVTPVDAKHPTGNIHKDPWLHIRCKLKPAQWKITDYYEDDYLGKYRITFDGIARNRSRGDNIIVSVENVKLDGPISMDLANRKIFLLPVTEFFFRRRKKIAGLVVTPVNNQEMRYERLGYFEMYKKDAGRLMYERRTSSFSNEGLKIRKKRGFQKQWWKIPARSIYLV